MTTPSFQGVRVLVTGHTGFKGGWLALLLSELGAEVHGYALDPPTEPSFFETCRISRRLASSTIADIRDAGAVHAAVASVRPSVVFHLAAQPLVRRSYREPMQTVATNVMGTVHVLQAAAEVDGVRAVLNVTSDKCYENRERPEPYREDDAMGGFDPYSASKGCAEILTAAWRRSFLSARGVRAASARAGNVIGGGDWAEDRLVPDFLRAIDAGRELAIRSPEATRPWQHVLEPVCGYARLAGRLLGPDGDRYAEAWNFGPSASDVRPVRWIVERLCAGVPGSRWSVGQGAGPHEAVQLSLDSGKAVERLGWMPTWDAGEAVERTLEWHRAWRRGDDMLAFTLRQLRDFNARAATTRATAGQPR